MHGGTGAQIFFSEKRHDLSQLLIVVKRHWKKKINSENTVSNEGCLYQNTRSYIKLNACVHGRVRNARKFFFLKKRHDLSQLLIVVKRHWKKK